MEVVIDFSTNTLYSTVQSDLEVSSFLSAITPNNFLSFLDFLKDAGYVVNDDYSDEIDYSVAEY